MNELMNEWRNEGMKGWRNEGMKEWMNEWINQSINQWNQWMNEWMHEMNEWMKEWRNEWMNEWINEWINESMNQWINQSINQWICVNFFVSFAEDYLAFLATGSSQQRTCSKAMPDNLLKQVTQKEDSAQICCKTCQQSNMSATTEDTVNMSTNMPGDQSLTTSWCSQN